MKAFEEYVTLGLYIGIISRIIYCVIGKALGY